MIEPTSMPTHLHLDKTGTLRVGGGNVALDDIVEAHRQGKSPTEILAAFPPLTEGELQAALDHHFHENVDVLANGVNHRDADWRRWNAAAAEETGTDIPDPQPSNHPRQDNTPLV